MKKWSFIINLAMALVNVSTLTVLVTLYLFSNLTIGALVLVAIVLTAIVVALSITCVILDARTEDTSKRLGR